MRSFSIGNRLRHISPIACGEGAPTFILASVGTSRASDDLGIELAKAQRAAALGASAVTDHSFYGDITGYHRMLTDNLDIAVSTVTNYEFAARCRDAGMSFRDAPDYLPIEILISQAELGLDVITVHASFLQRHLPLVAASSRIIPTTSKGGGIISSYIRTTSKENPYYRYFDDILNVFREYNVTLSLGTAFRPATVCDGWDALLFEELFTMGELVVRAIDAGVPVMVEGIGHAHIGQIQTYIKLAKEICHHVPYRVLPMATDTALGFDHISGAIAAAVAVAAGADAVTCISRAEHIGLPSQEDLEEAIIATRIAAHCGELPKLGDFSKDKQMSLTRWQQGCKGDWTAAIYPEGARAALERRGRLADQLVQCSMCGAYCGIAAGLSTVRHGRT